MLSSSSKRNTVVVVAALLAGCPSAPQSTRRETSGDRQIYEVVVSVVQMNGQPTVKVEPKTVYVYANNNSNRIHWVLEPATAMNWILPAGAAQFDPNAPFKPETDDDPNSDTEFCLHDLSTPQDNGTYKYTLQVQPKAGGPAIKIDPAIENHGTGVGSGG